MLPIACRKGQSGWLRNKKAKGKDNEKSGNQCLAWAFSEAAGIARRYAPACIGSPRLPPSRRISRFPPACGDLGRRAEKRLRKHRLSCLNARQTTEIIRFSPAIAMQPIKRFFLT